VKIEIPGWELLALVKEAQTAVAARTTKPVLTCVLLDAHDDLLTVTGMDLEVGCRRTASAVVRRAGRCCVPADRLAKVLGEIAGVAELHADGDTLVVRVVGQKSKWTLPVYDAAEFPDFPQAIDGGKFTAEASALVRALDQSEYAAGRQDSSPRYAVNALLVEAVDGGVSLVGTDTKRIGSAGVTAAVDGWPEGVLVPLRAVKAIRAAVAGFDGPVVVTANRNEIEVVAGGACVWSRLVSGRFPMWRQIVPKTSAHTFVADAAALGAKVKQAAVTADDELRRVDVTFSPGLVRMAAKGAETGASEVEMPLAIDFDLEIAFDPVYLRGVCAACLEAGGSEMTVRITDSSKPAVFEWGGGMALVMPMGERD
jgi:DNA polymerase-3 subunit beta